MTLAKFLPLLSPCHPLNNEEIRPGFLEGPFQSGFIAPPLRSLPQRILLYPDYCPLLSSPSRCTQLEGRTLYWGQRTACKSILPSFIKFQNSAGSLLGPSDRGIRLATPPPKGFQSSGGNRHTVNPQQAQESDKGNPEAGAQRGADPGGEVREGCPEHWSWVLKWVFRK